MKLFFTAALSIIAIGGLQAQQPATAKTGTTYGAKTDASQAISADDLESKLSNGKYDGKIIATVTEVCQEKGCWMKVERASGEPLMVKFKDYGYFMPKDIVGKKVVLDGEATTKEVSVKQQKHYAEDAGKPKEEIEKIKKPKKELQFVADGVLVL
ncbi:MAG: DUF4920 domain-containing protein [Flavitalea sp.]